MLRAIGERAVAISAAEDAAQKLADDMIKLTPVEKDLRERKVRTWNRLMARTPDYSTALKLLKQGRGLGIEPNVVTYNTLISLAPDYATAQGLVEQMRAEGIEPDVVTYNTLFSTNLSGTSADQILGWYLSQPYHPEEPIQAAIASYRMMHSIADALQLAMSYPHLPAARKVVREYQEEALSYFRSIAASNPSHPNAEYALGVALVELGRQTEASPHLTKALEQAKADPRRCHIMQLLQELGGSPSGTSSSG